MSDKRNEERLIIALMVFVLISLLFFSSVAFGQVVSLSEGYGQVAGNVYYSDGTTPFEANDANNGTYIGLFDATNSTRIDWTTSSASGSYSSQATLPGNYYLEVFVEDELVATSPIFAINSGEITSVDLQTSRMPTIQKIYESSKILNKTFLFLIHL